MSSFIHTAGGASARAIARTRVLLSDLFTAIREARQLEATLIVRRLSAGGLPTPETD